MVRNYIRKTSTKRVNYSQDDMARALIDLNKGSSVRLISARYGIPKSTLSERFLGNVERPGELGRKTALLKYEEVMIANNLASLGDYGLAFTDSDLRSYIKDYLDEGMREIPQFKNNLPGIEWVRGFLSRHSELLKNRKCQNISRVRAAVSIDTVEKYFQNLENSLRDVPPENIINYDETNFTDDPGSIKMIFRTGPGRAERIMNTSKVSTSLMFACTPTGQ